MNQDIPINPRSESDKVLDTFCESIIIAKTDFQFLITDANRFQTFSLLCSLHFHSNNRFDFLYAPHFIYNLINLVHTSNNCCKSLGVCWKEKRDIEWATDGDCRSWTKRGAMLEVG